MLLVLNMYHMAKVVEWALLIKATHFAIGKQFYKAGGLIRQVSYNRNCHLR